MSTPTDLLHRLKYIGKKLNTCLILEYALKPLPQGYFRAPPGGPKGVGLMTTFSNMFHMDKSTREKNMIIVSFQNWHWQNNPNLQN